MIIFYLSIHDSGGVFFLLCVCDDGAISLSLLIATGSIGFEVENRGKEMLGGSRA